MWPMIRSRGSAFTLVEVLVVIAIIAILVGLLLPAVQKVRAASARTQCQNHLKQLGIALHHYHEDHRSFPSGFHTNGFFGVTWFCRILPYVEQESLARAWDYNLTPTAAGNNTRDDAGILSPTALSATPISIFVCPADRFAAKPAYLTWPHTTYIVAHFGVASYAGNCGTYSAWFSDNFEVIDGATVGRMKTDGVLYLTGLAYPPGLDQRPPNLLQIVDGTSQTFLVGERFHEDPLFDSLLYKPPLYKSRYPIHGWSAWGWMGGGPGTAHVLASPRERINYRVPAGTFPTHNAANIRVAVYGSGHTGGANFGLADGSVRFLRDETELDLLKAMSTRAGNEPVATE